LVLSHTLAYCRIGAYQPFGTFRDFPIPKKRVLWRHRCYEFRGIPGSRIRVPVAGAEAGQGVQSDRVRPVAQSATIMQYGITNSEHGFAGAKSVQTKVECSGKIMLAGPYN